LLNCRVGKIVLMWCLYPKTMKPYGSIQRSWDIARKAAGLPEVRMYDFRHSMASNMVNSGRSIYEEAKVLGHSQLKTTQRYAHLSQETLLAGVDAAADATGINWGQTKTDNQSVTSHPSTQLVIRSLRLSGGFKFVFFMAGNASSVYSFLKMLEIAHKPIDFKRGMCGMVLKYLVTI